MIVKMRTNDYKNLIAFLIYIYIKRPIVSIQCRRKILANPAVQRNVIPKLKVDSILSIHLNI